jgi:hypothetical protein
MCVGFDFSFYLLLLDNILNDLLEFVCLNGFWMHI